ncbi:MAG: glycosyl transferase, partial [Reichenbachiella sp.]
MSKKKVLIITYYWPPSGGGGVQRWLKFAKYLPQFGWEPIVFTPENPEFDLKDDSLKKDISPELEVIKFPIWEPFGVYKKLFKKKEKLKQGIVIEKANMSFIDKL